MARRFVVQQHDATTLHFDLRLQAGEFEAGAQVGEERSYVY